MTCCYAFEYVFYFQKKILFLSNFVTGIKGIFQSLFYFKFDVCCIFFDIFFFDDTLPSSNMAIQGHFRYYYLLSLTVQLYARQLNIFILTNRTTSLGMYSISKIKLIGDWSVENIEPEMTPDGL